MSLCDVSSAEWTFGIALRSVHRVRELPGKQAQTFTTLYPGFRLAVTGGAKLLVLVSRFLLFDYVPQKISIKF